MNPLAHTPVRLMATGSGITLKGRNLVGWIFVFERTFSPSRWNSPISHHSRPFTCGDASLQTCRSSFFASLPARVNTAPFASGTRHDFRYLLLMRTLSLLFVAASVCMAGVTPPEQIKVPPGFKVELLREAGPREGSWICMAQDDQGRLYISPQGAIPESGFGKDSQWGGIWRATVRSNQSSVISEKGVPPITNHQSLITAHGARVAQGEPEYGLEWGTSLWVPRESGWVRISEKCW